MSTGDEDRGLPGRIARCVESGKLDAETDIPRGSRGQPGVVELVREGLQRGLPAKQLLDDGLLAGLSAVGRRFAAGEVFIPEVLIAARAMKAGVELLRPHLSAGEAEPRGEFIIGTVRGDLHDIGKNLVAIMLEGAGWRVHDLGVDCPPQRFVEALREHPGAAVGLSALLTTTMLHMKDTVAAIRDAFPQTVILVGGAPVTEDFAREIGADGYGADPQQAIEILDRLCPRAA